MENSLKQDLIDHLKQYGAHDVRIADPNTGYEHVKPGKHPDSIWKPFTPKTHRKHPYELMKECKSVVVFTVACAPETNNTYYGAYSPYEGERRTGPLPKDFPTDEYAMSRIDRLMVSHITLRGMEFLASKGFSSNLIWPSLYTPNLKVSGYEAGIGVYGRAGFLIHPVLGNRMRLGYILTDAVLEPDGRLEGFNPCRGCRLCVDECPGEAFDDSLDYPYSFDRVRCMDKRREIADEGLYCHSCWAVCPAGRLDDEKLLHVYKAKSYYESHR